MKIVLSFSLLLALTKISRGYTTLQLLENDTCKRKGEEEWRCKLPDDCRRGLASEGTAPLCEEPMICCPPERHARDTSENKANVFCERHMTDNCNRNLYVGESDTSNRLRMNVLDEEEKAALLDVRSVDEKEHPYMALIGYGGGKKWACGGILIDDQFILTSAHCANKPGLGQPTSVRLGSGNQIQESHINRVVVHPDYVSGSMNHDLALLKMRDYVIYNDVVKPVCLYTMPRIPYEEVLAVGWSSHHTAQQELREATLIMKNTSFCDVDGASDDSFLCASDGGRSMCEGLAGRMLVVRMGSRCLRSLVGLTTTEACSPTDSRVLYTRVSYHQKWIESVVWPY